MPKASTVLFFALAAAGGLFAWAYVKSRQTGSSGGVFGTIKGAFSGADNLVQGATDATIGLGAKWGGAAGDAGQYVGGKVVLASQGALGIARDTTSTISDTTNKLLSVGGNLNPKNVADKITSFFGF